MANRLNMVKAQAILALHAQGYSQRRIAEELEVHRETVGRVLHDSKPAKAPTGVSTNIDDSKPAKAPTGVSTDVDGSEWDATTDVTRSGGREPEAPVSRPPAPPPSFPLPCSVGERSVDDPPIGRSSCEPWRDLIRSKLAVGLSSTRIHQDLVREHGFTGSYYSVRRFVEHLDAKVELPFRRMHSEPGGEAQVDFGTGAMLTGDGKRRRTHVFRIVLSHSRKAYSEAVTRQTTEDFLRCLENAFWHFGGVPRRLVLDNLKAAVTKADWYDPDIHPKVRSFCEHYGIVPLPTKPYTPRHKGKVERGVAYVQDNALKGRTFTSLAEQNQFLADWEHTVADTRLHGTTRRQVGAYFEQAERAALLPLPIERFPFFHEAQRVVHRDGHVEVAKAYYSVPPEYLGRRLWARWDARLVRIFDLHMRLLETHVRQEPGGFSTKHQHLAGEKINSVERGAAWLIQRVQRIGTQSTAWAVAVLHERGIEGVRVVQGLLNLATKHKPRTLEHACGIALSRTSYRLRTVRALLDRQPPHQQEFDFIDRHEIIRDLSEYAALATCIILEETP